MGGSGTNEQQRDTNENTTESNIDPAGFTSVNAITQTRGKEGEDLHQEIQEAAPKVSASS